jgi:hypothetical protein
MPKIVPIIEGDGDFQAVPILLRRILTEELNLYTWEVARPKKANSLTALQKRLSDYIQYAQIEPDCGAILILLDLDDGCPKEQAVQLVEQIKKEYLKYPVAVVLAHREYEGWFLASAEALRGQHNLPAELHPPESPEIIRDAKGWLTEHMPNGMIYKETTHQPAMTVQMDFELVKSRSRSFRRLLHALEQLTNSALPQVTPSP